MQENNNIVNIKIKNEGDNFENDYQEEKGVIGMLSRQEVSRGDNQ